MDARQKLHFREVLLVVPSKRKVLQFRTCREGLQQERRAYPVKTREGNQVGKGQRVAIIVQDKMGVHIVVEISDIDVPWIVRFTNTDSPKVTPRNTVKPKRKIAKNLPYMSRRLLQRNFFQS